MVAVHSTSILVTICGVYDLLELTWGEVVCGSDLWGSRLLQSIHRIPLQPAVADAKHKKLLIRSCFRCADFEAFSQVWRNSLISAGPMSSCDAKARLSHQVPNSVSSRNRLLLMD